MVRGSERTGHTMLSKSRSAILALLVMGPRLALAGGAELQSSPPLPLFDGHSVVARIIVPEHPSELETRAANYLNEQAQNIFGFRLPVISASQTRDFQNSIIFGTTADNPAFKGETGGASLAHQGGYAIRRDGPSSLVVIGRDDSGVFNGAVYLASFALQSDGTRAVLDTAAVRRDSPILNRGTYNLVCWGLAPRYTLQDWEKVLDSMEEDGMNVVYFWLAGIFRSQAFPESFIYPETPLTTEDIRQLIRYAHSRGIEFYLGSGVFAWFGVDSIAQQHPEFRNLGIPYMSRTLPAARVAMKRYLHEMYDTFPEADGMWMEIGDEGEYACHDPECQKPLDDFGSKASSQASASFLKEFSAELWKTHPQAKLAWGIGYPEAHQWDVKYYDTLRQSFQDPRYYFLEVRQNWMLQDRNGILEPIQKISPHTMHWDQYYALPLRDIGERARRVWEDGLAGYIVAFEPGFNSHSVFGRSIPFPVDVIPYRLTRFAYREFTQDPSLTWSGFRQRLLTYFFGEKADPALCDITLTLFEFMRTGPISGLFNELVDPVDGRAYGKMLRPRLIAIEARLAQLEPASDPRAKAVGFPLLRRAIQDLRTGYSIQ